MVVTFYKTKMNNQNRCYGAEQYDTYLNSCEKLEITLSHDIVPNNPFNIATDNGMWSYNYITYTYKGYYFGAFINSISIQAISGTTVISHTTDTWYFALKNIGIENIDFHGKVMRGHVKDTDENHRPILDNTTLTAEEVFNNSNLKYCDFANITVGQSSVIEKQEFSDCWFLYIYFANPNKVLDWNLTDQAMNINDDVKFVNNGLTCVFPVVIAGEGFYVCKIGESGELQKDCLLSSITNGDITSMTLSKIAPIESLYFKSDNTQELKYSLIGMTNYQTYSWKSTAENLPYKAIVFAEFTGSYISTEYYRADDNEYFLNINGLNIRGDALSETHDYDTYLKEIPKFTSLVYNPFYFGDSIYDWYHSSYRNGNAYPLKICIGFDLSSYILYRDSDNLIGNRKLVVVENKSLFAPDTVLDYWTRLNALQTANAGKIQENAAINQGITNTVNIVKKTANVVSTAAKGAGSAFTLNIGKAISNGVAAAADTVSASADLAGASINYQRNQENAELSKENGQIIQQTANFQYDTGTTNESAGTGFYNSIKPQSFISIIDNSANYKQICTNLHRYGYNTFLQLDEVYFNHVREHFNYIKCSEVEVTGVTEDIASDIANMFLTGVHLWQDDVENFDRTNYSKGEWNV